VLVVRNAGPGVVVLRGEDEGSTDVWRLASSRALGADEVVLLVYDGAAARWRIVGAGPRPATAGPGSPQ
jgi:hypothetical protein